VALMQRGSARLRRRPWVVLAAAAVTLAAAASGVHGCGKGVCQDYGTEPSFDSSSRPPSKGVLGRATWTVLHTTAAYLPDEATEDELAAFRDLVRTVPLLYPGKGRVLADKILSDTLVKSELDSIESTQDAQLLVWKVSACRSPRSAIGVIVLRPGCCSPLSVAGSESEGGRRLRKR
jgi:hypothetical protein